MRADENEDVHVLVVGSLSMVSEIVNVSDGSKSFLVDVYVRVIAGEVEPDDESVLVGLVVSDDDE